MRAFWRLPKTPLMQLAKHLGCQVPIFGATLLEVLNTLIRFICPDLDDEGVLSVLQQRAMNTDSLQDFVECREAEDS